MNALAVLTPRSGGLSLEYENICSGGGSFVVCASLINF